MAYTHETALAPTVNMLDDYKKKRSSWDHYERLFLDLMSQRQIELTIQREMLNNSVLLCSEPTAHHCHRRLVAEYFADSWQGVRVTHL